MIPADHRDWGSRPGETPAAAAIRSILASVDHMFTEAGHPLTDDQRQLFLEAIGAGS